MYKLFCTGVGECQFGFSSKQMNKSHCIMSLININLMLGAHHLFVSSSLFFRHFQQLSSPQWQESPIKLIGSTANLD